MMPLIMAGNCKECARVRLLPASKYIIISICEQLQGRGEAVEGRPQAASPLLSLFPPLGVPYLGGKQRWGESRGGKRRQGGLAHLLASAISDSAVKK